MFMVFIICLCTADVIIFVKTAADPRGGADPVPVIQNADISDENSQ